jgi:hypothetical protein
MFMSKHVLSQMIVNRGLTKKKELFTTTPSTDTCRGGKNQLFDLFSQPRDRIDFLVSPQWRYCCLIHFSFDLVILNGSSQLT